MYRLRRLQHGRRYILDLGIVVCHIDGGIRPWTFGVLFPDCFFELLRIDFQQEEIRIERKEEHEISI